MTYFGYFVVDRCCWLPSHRRRFSPRVTDAMSHRKFERPRHGSLGFLPRKRTKYLSWILLFFWLMLFFCHSDHSEFLSCCCFSDWCFSPHHCVGFLFFWLVFFFCLGFDHSDAFHGQKMWKKYCRYDWVILSHEIWAKTMLLSAWFRGIITARSRASPRMIHPRSPTSLRSWATRTAALRYLRCRCIPWTFAHWCVMRYRHFPPFSPPRTALGWHDPHRAGGG